MGVLQQLEHIQIPVRDLEESIKWYTINLGFTLQNKSDEFRHAFLTLPNGPMLMLWETSDETNANFTRGGETMPVLLFRTNQIRQLHDRLESLGVDITFYQDEGFAWVLKFIDLNGNVWGVIHYK